PSQLAILGLSGSDDRTMTAQFLKAGANDFLYKPFNQEELFCRIHHLLEMKEAHLEMYRLANQDALTGLWNRRYLFNQSCPSSCSARSVAMLDIDFFKKVNDNYGHDAGD
ncbi:diguanylate cyclase, partial [Vibrio campbellii]